MNAPSAMPIAARGYAHPDILVDTEWVAAHQHDPNVRLLESNEDLLLYETGHIAGAVKIDWVDDLNDAIVRDYVDRDQFQSLLRAKVPSRLGRGLTAGSGRSRSTSCSTLLPGATWSTCGRQRSTAVNGCTCPTIPTRVRCAGGTFPGRATFRGLGP